MNLRWKALESKVSSQARRLVRVSPHLRQQYRAARKKRRRSYQLPGSQFLLALLVIVPTLSRSQLGHADLVAGLGFIVLGVAVAGAAHLLQVLNGSSHLFVLGHYPLEDRQVARFQFRRFVRQMVFWFCMPMAFCASVALNQEFSWMSLARGVAAGVLPGFLTFALIPILAAWAPPAILGRVTLPLVLVSMGFFLFGPKFPRVIDYAAEILVWIPSLPLALTPLMPGSRAGTVFQIGSFIFLLGTLAAAVMARQKLVHGFHWDEHVLAWTELARAEETRTPVAAPEWADLFRTQPDAVEPLIRQGVFLQPFEWKHLGWLENLVARFWTPEEQRIAEFLTARRPHWSQQFRTVLIAIVVLVAVTSVFGGLAALMEGGLAVFVVILAISWAVGSGSASWPGFALQAGPGLQPPIYASYPVGFWQMFRVVVKANTVRYLVTVPALGLGLLAAVKGEVTSTGAGLFVRLAICGLILMPMTMIFAVSAGTNDTHRPRYWLPAIVLAVSLVAGLVLFIWAPGKFWAVVGFSATLILSWGITALYGWLFSRGKMDLIPLRRSDQL